MERLLVLKKYINQVQFFWEGLGALIELWHPQIHTFIFPSFEVTILLEEIKILFELKSSSNDNVACPLGDIHVLEILSEFMSKNDARFITTPNGLDLLKLARWCRREFLTSC